MDMESVQGESRDGSGSTERGPEGFGQKLKAYWYSHGQKTIATVLGVLAVVDMTKYTEDFHAIIPWPYWSQTLRLAGCAGIVWRAVQANRGK